MKILFISKYATPPNYGTASRIFHLSEEMNSLGSDVSILTSDANHFGKFPKYKKIYNELSSEKYKVNIIRTIKYKRTTSLKRILSWIDFEMKVFYLLFLKRAYLPDILVVSSLSFFTILNGLLFKFFFKVPLVFEIRDIWPLTLTAEGGYKNKNPLIMLMSFIEKIGYKYSDLIIGTMPGLDKHLEKLNIKNKRFFCSPLGFYENSSFDQKKQDLQQIINLDDKKITIGYAGSMGITNALDNFIETIILMKDNPNVQFALVGSGDLRNTYYEKLNNLNNVAFGPKIPSNLVPHFLDNCDILYLSTHDSEVWDYGQSMNKLVDYMLAGKTIIASYSGMQSMINEANCGEFISTKDPNKLKEIFEKYISLGKLRLNEIGLRGKHWLLENRSYKNLACTYLNELQKTVDEK